MNNFAKVVYDATAKLMLGFLQRNLLPDVVIRRLTRFLLANRLRSCSKPTSQQQLQHLLDFVHCMITDYDHYWGGWSG
ncbi:hypothetical protein OSB04_014648 [Centaurea solstitialis]|uniref:Uncharacterized protein n=1 Tax=Centaurea solstitialis TaxID=347529 RepID=A0AA38SXN7_9ASTR|nr:hypothetical protein OSB04_014648 [Centaurea solstitialis]